MENYLLNFVLLMVPAILSSMAEKTKIPPLMNAVKDGKNTAITPSSSSSSSHQRETNLIDLTIDIQINIINRLSMKSLFQFRSVCKSWRTLLLTREISVHLNLISDKIYTLSTNADFHDRGICRFKIPIELQSLEFMLLEPVNGIVCIIGPVFSHVTFAYLWNPLTNEFKHLPKPNVQLGYVAIGFGFGFVPKSNDYKVVRVVHHERKFDSYAEVYSLNRDSWRRVKDDSCSISSEMTENERSNAWMRRILQGVVTVDLENEVTIQEERRYFNHKSHEADHRRKHCRTNTWRDHRDAILLNLPVDELILFERPRDEIYSYGSSTKFDFSGSLVSLSRNHDNLGL